MTCNNAVSEAARSVNSGRLLTPSLDLGKEGLAMKATRTCSHPDGCPKPVKAYGWCGTHRSRILKTGSPGPAETARVYQRSDRVCSHLDCDDKHLSNGYCVKHYTRIRRNGDPDIVLKVHDSDEIGYRAAHNRVQARRGPAATYSCGHCGGSPASQWAYDYMDPDERRGANGVSECVYSTDPAHYLPLCAPCHKRFDLSRRNK